MKSRSEQFIANRMASAPKITPNMAKSVSSFRKDALKTETERGLFSDGTPGNNQEDQFNSSTKNGIVLGGPSRKFAQQSSVTSSNQWRGGSGDAIRQTQEVYSPFWLNSNLNLPRDRSTVNAWCRTFFTLNPIVHNTISLHSTYPISKLNIRCPNKKVEKFFNEMIEELDLMNIAVQIAQEFWLLGEAFIYAELDEDKGKWSRLVIQNPDYMIVKRTGIDQEPLVMLKPDDHLKQIVKSNKPQDIEQRRLLNQTIIDYVKKGQNIPLDNFNISHLARRISPYEVRGTGLPVSAFRSLMLWDKLKECKYAQADNMINPLTLVKIGSADYKPGFQDLEAWRNVWEESQYDKDFKIFTHEGVTVERIGYNSGILDTSNDFTQILKEIYAALMTPSAVMDGGGDTTYANASVALDVLRQRYMAFRNMMSAWLRRKIFAPISKLNEFFEYKDGEKVLIVPEVDWNHMSLFDAGDYINTLTQLMDKKAVSIQTVYRSLGLEWEEEQRKMRKERIAAAIAMKEEDALKQISLNELRALGDDDEIPEPSQTPVPGENPYVSGPAGGGNDSSSGMGGGLGGGMGGGLGGGMESSSGPPPLPPLPGAGGPST